MTYHIDILINPMMMEMVFMMKLNAIGLDVRHIGDFCIDPNVNGIRSDIVEAFKNIHLPVLRWPGGCFACQCLNILNSKVSPCRFLFLSLPEGKHRQMSYIPYDEEFK